MVQEEEKKDGDVHMADAQKKEAGAGLFGKQKAAAGGRGRKKSVEKKQVKGFYRPRAASLCDYASDEEVDSDELGSEIEGTRQQ
jgi:hypothetical protein